MGQALLCRLKDGVAVSHGQEINGTAEGMKAVMDVGDHSASVRVPFTLVAAGT